MIVFSYFDLIAHTCARGPAAPRARCCWPRAAGGETLSGSSQVSLLMMEKPMLMSAALFSLRTVVPLLLLTSSCPLLGSSVAASGAALRRPGELSFPYSSIFSPLLRALSEHGGPSWSRGLRKKTRPEHRYMKYLTEVYKPSSRVQRSLDGSPTYNTVRLIKPQDECLARSNKGEEVKHTEQWIALWTGDQLELALLNKMMWYLENERKEKRKKSCSGQRMSWKLFQGLQTCVSLKSLWFIVLGMAVLIQLNVYFIGKFTIYYHGPDN